MSDQTVQTRALLASAAIATALADDPVVDDRPVTQAMLEAVREHLAGQKESERTGN